MNKRIRLLADEAEEWNADGDKCEVNLTKFAQLIVRECTQVILETPVEYNEIDTMHRIRDRVKEHFGVEE